MNVYFSMLGPVRAWRGPVELSLGPNQQRAILALLLIRANHLVSVDELIELLWEEKPPASAVNVIHKYIGAIRRLLEPDHEPRASGRWLARHGTAYRLDVDEDMSDLMSFRRMVRDAGLAHAANQSANALELYRHARYRGGEVRAIADIGIAHSKLGRYQEAVSHLQRGIALAQEVGTVQQEGKARKELGIVLSQMRHHDKAVAELRLALKLLRHVGYLPQEAETLLALGNALLAQGLEEAAYDAWQQSLMISSTFRLPDGEILPQRERVKGRLLKARPDPVRALPLKHQW
jgi:tetratricopeptide (TPR) repeat protein